MNESDSTPATTFHLIRYRRTFLASEIFDHIPKGHPHDYEIVVAGTYQGQKGPKMPFSEALFMTAKQADRMTRRLIREEIPADIIERVTVQIAEPT